MKKELLTYEDPKSPVSEIFRTLRTNIQFMNTDRKLKTCPAPRSSRRRRCR